VQAKLAEKSDYPKNLSILNKPDPSAEYHQLVEASASAYFEIKGLARWIFPNCLKLLGNIHKN